MSDELVLNGKTYVSSRKAAEVSGYARDYIGQLSRAGHIDAERVGGLWYVSMDSLHSYEKNADSAKMISATSFSKDAESTLIFEGKDYVSASRASKISGYNQDYVGQLARGGKIPSRQIGNRWYVDREALLKHKSDKDALLAAVQAEAMGLGAYKEPEGVRVEHLPTPSSALQYIPEDRDLLPQLRKEQQTGAPYERKFAIVTPPRSMVQGDDQSGDLVSHNVNPAPKVVIRSRSNTAKKLVISGGVGALAIVLVLSAGMIALGGNPAFASVRESVISGSMMATAAHTLSRVGDMIENVVSPELRYERPETWR